MSNRLINETSPYLLQHAHNPVDWFAWGDEAIEKARTEDKPMLVSIGYSACHWCHVMEKESFENEETAALMNLHFVNIKIDREERPDLDQIYMDAVQAIAGNGGWPLNVFLTPEGKPFYGGTYFPPVSFQNRPSWKTILLNIAQAFREQRPEIEKQAGQLTNHIAEQQFVTTEHGEGDFQKQDLQKIFEQLMATADRVDGGFGPAPKFPQTFSIRFLLQHQFYSGNQDALDQACLSLDKMIRGGIYDQLGGGFARYSTDAVLLVPHFEKMLYDNALLIMAMSEAFQSTRRDTFAKAVRETMDFIQRELTSQEGGFYSALDADSEGEEGKFYIWNKSELQSVLGSEFDLFSRVYDVTDEGNWEGKTILTIKNPDIPVSPEIEKEWKRKLLEVRSKRVRPNLDDKILLGWNALMITASAKAYAAFGIEEYRQAALRAIDFLEKNMQGEGIFRFCHNYKERPKRDAPGLNDRSSKGEVGAGNGRNLKGETEPGRNKGGKALIPAFLDDYAYLIEAYIHLQEITGETVWLNRAGELTEWVIDNFGEEEGLFFYYTHKDQDDVIIRKREVYDGATPSGNSVMAANLLYLGTVFDRNEWKKRASGSAGGMKDVIRRYPGSFGVWATLINGLTYSLYEIVLAGNFSQENHLELLSKTIPNRVLQLTSATPSDLPLLRNKPVLGMPLYFLCRDYNCQQPVKEVTDLISLLKNS